MRWFAWSVLGAALAVPCAALDQNSIVVTGEVTHVDTELGFIVVQSNHAPGAFTEILLPCPATTPGCAEVDAGDDVLVLAHFAEVVAVCGGEELPDNPIVIDHLALCADRFCEKF